MIVLTKSITFLVEKNSIHDSVRATNVTNVLEQRRLTSDLEDILYDTKDSNENINKSESLLQLKNRSWFEHLVHQAMRNYEQMQLNTTSNRQSKQFIHQNDTISNITSVSENQLKALDNKRTADNRISFQENGMD